MAIDRDDPRLTAYALGEMSDEERAKFEAELGDDAEVRAEIEAIGALGRDLSSELERGAPDGLGEERRNAILASAEKSEQRPKLVAIEGGGKKAEPAEKAARPARWRLVATVSSLAVAAAAIFFVTNTGQKGAADHETREEAPAAAASAAAAAPRGRSHYGVHSEAALDDDAHGRAKAGSQEPATPPAAATSNPFALAPNQAEATASASAPPEGRVSAIFGLAAKPSLDDVSGFDLQTDGQLPSPSGARVDGLLASFTFSYPTPPKGLAVSSDVASVPWAPDHRLVRIGVSGHVDAPAKAGFAGGASVRFDTRVVRSWSLLGDAASAGSPDGSVSATALYDVETTTTATPTAPLHLGDVDVTAPPSTSTPMTDTGTSFAAASDDFRFAASVVAFGQLLEHRTLGAYSYDDVARIAAGARGRDTDGKRKAFADLVARAGAVAKKE